MQAYAILPYGVGIGILAAKAKDAQADVTALEREIDEIVYRLYGLSADEITVVQETTGKCGGLRAMLSMKVEQVLALCHWTVVPSL